MKEGKVGDLRANEEGSMGKRGGKVRENKVVEVREMRLCKGWRIVGSERREVEKVRSG